MPESRFRVGFRETKWPSTHLQSNRTRIERFQGVGISEGLSEGLSTRSTRIRHHAAGDTQDEQHHVEHGDNTEDGDGDPTEDLGFFGRVLSSRHVAIGQFVIHLGREDKRYDPEG